MKRTRSIQEDFKGDVVGDDVSYFDERMFQDGSVAQRHHRGSQRPCNLLFVGGGQLW